MSTTAHKLYSPRPSPTLHTGQRGYRPGAGAGTQGHAADTTASPPPAPHGTGAQVEQALPVTSECGVMGYTLQPWPVPRSLGWNSPHSFDSTSPWVLVATYPKYWLGGHLPVNCRLCRRSRVHAQPPLTPLTARHTPQGHSFLEMPGWPQSTVVICL